MKYELEVKEWMAKKIGAEKKRHYYDIDVYGTLEETEKAVKLIFASETNGIYTAWCPKSCIIVCDENSRCDGKSFNRTPSENADLEKVIAGYRFESFADAVRAYNDRMFFFR